MRIPLRLWATPLTVAGFSLMTATGVLMFFELDAGLTAVVHQWFSWLFLAGAGAHVATNFRPFKKHLKSRWGVTTLAVCSTIFGAALSSWGMVTGPQLERPIEMALVDAPLAALAQVTGADPAVLLARLRAEGVDAETSQSIREIAGARNMDENRLLGLVFLPDAAGF